MPNVSLCSALSPCIGPAIILAPSGPNVGSLAGVALFRPLNNQPFTQFPYVGGSAGDFGLNAGQIGQQFGFPGFNAQIGAPTGSGGRFARANSFPGLGSPLGSILPGVVLATVQLPCTALTGNCRPPGSPGSLNPITVPTTFTIAPSYLPDAPFLSRPYGESSFTNYVVGAKIRFTGPHNPLGAGIIPFYRWYPDNADTAGGFSQLQRGASPGGKFLKGDVGLIGFVDGRLSKHVNVSANVGYILNSNPKSDAMGGATILDRPNEFLVGVGLDFPVNKHFQPIAEVRTTRYVGGHTLNAFENNPTELLGGAKIFPRRWWGFGVAYRRHLNQQDSGHIEKADFSVGVANVTGVFVTGRGSITVPGTSFPATTNGIPNGFRLSSDPSGFIIQFWAGHRNPRTLPPPPCPPPTVSASAGSSSITLSCPPGTSSDSCPATSNLQVSLTADAHSDCNAVLLYTWTATGGKVTGEGKTVSWDLADSQPGTYTATVQVSDGTHPAVTSSTTVTIASCPNCKPPCPTVSVSGQDSVEQGTPITFTANVGSNAPSGITYNWSVSAGTISGGQGTSSITVDTANLGGQTVTATVELGGLDPTCTRTASASTGIKNPPVKACSKFDEYGNIKFNDEKARLDNFASDLQNKAGAQGYIIGYGACEGEGLARANRAKDYMVNTRGIDAGRITVVDGGCRAELWVQLYTCETGAPPPTAMTDAAVSPCPACKKKKVVRPRRTVRHGKKKAGDEDDE